MNKQLRETFRKCLNHGYSTPPGRAVCALRSARTIIEFEKLEHAGLVRLECIPEEDNYWSVCGKPETEKERKFVEDFIDRWGLWVVCSQYLDDAGWKSADSIGMCMYHDPLSPFENDYVPGLMAAAMEHIGQPGEH
jgi:hypothetical protein